MRIKHEFAIPVRRFDEAVEGARPKTSIDDSRRRRERNLSTRRYHGAEQHGHYQQSDRAHAHVILRKASEHEDYLRRSGYGPTIRPRLTTWRIAGAPTRSRSTSSPST